MDYNTILYGIIHIITLIITIYIMKKYVIKGMKRALINSLINDQEEIKAIIKKVLIDHNTEIQSLSTKLKLSRDELKRIDLTLHPVKNYTETIINDIHAISVLTSAIHNTLDERKKLEEKIRGLKKENIRLREFIRELELRI